MLQPNTELHTTAMIDFVRSEQRTEQVFGTVLPCIRVPVYLDRPARSLKVEDAVPCDRPIKPLPVVTVSTDL
jgi:hypothetical protein